MTNRVEELQLENAQLRENLILITSRQSGESERVRMLLAKELIIDMLKLLREIEWNHEFDGELCPACKGGKDKATAVDPGHYPECKLAEIITRGEELLR